MTKKRRAGARQIDKVSLLVLRDAAGNLDIGGVYATPAAADAAAGRYPARVDYAVKTLPVGVDQFLVPRIERMERVDGVDAAIASLTDPGDEGPADPGPLPLDVTNA